MSWRLLRKSRMRALDTALRKGKVDEEMVNLLQAIGKSQKLAPLASCGGRVFLARWEIGKAEPGKYFSIWHSAEREEVELALSRHGVRKNIWFAVEPFSLSVAAKDAESAFSFSRKMKRRDVLCSISKKKGRYDIEARGPFRMSFPVNPIEGYWNDIVDAANELMDENLKVIKKLEKVRW
ncbi:MAG: tRNA-wybutosine modification methyltransferase TYW3 [Candidatus Thorarchaeota archaeon]|jgi:tRNA(Phe) wybutosine-synthesizing methylase Tyw3